MDNLILVPTICNNISELKICVMKEMNRSLRNIAKKFQLKKQISGWRIYEYITFLFHKFFKDVYPNIWLSLPNFKSFYYQTLFRLMYTFKRNFGVKENEAIMNLENMIVNTIYNFKETIYSKDFNYALLD